MWTRDILRDWWWMVARTAVMAAETLKVLGVMAFATAMVFLVALPLALVADVLGERPRRP